jgi:hypothetical protein
MNRPDAGAQDKRTTVQLLWATLLVTGLNLVLAGSPVWVQAALLLMQLVLLGLLVRSWLRAKASS